MILASAGCCQPRRVTAGTAGPHRGAEREAGVLSLWANCNSSPESCPRGGEESLTRTVTAPRDSTLLQDIPRHPPMPSAPFLHEHLPAQRLGSSPRTCRDPMGANLGAPALELLHQPSRGVPGTWGVPTWPPVFAPGPELVWPQPQPGTGAEIRILPPRRDPQPLGWRPPGREEELLDGDKKWPLWPPGASHGHVCRGGNAPWPCAPGGHLQARWGRGAAAAQDPAPLPPPLPPAQPPKANPPGIRGRAAVISWGHQPGATSPCSGAAGRVPPCHPGTSPWRGAPWRRPQNPGVSPRLTSAS